MGALQAACPALHYSVTPVHPYIGLYLVNLIHRVYKLEYSYFSMALGHPLSMKRSKLLYGIIEVHILLIFLYESLQFLL